MKMENKNVAVIGGSRGLGREFVAATRAWGAQTLAVARGTQDLAQLEAQAPGVVTLALDATEEDAPSRVFERLRPDVLVVCAGALPFMAPLHEQTWPGFSRAWHVDVKASFHFCQAALNLPLSPGATVVLISSGAALQGSSISGGYAGAKRTQMFLAQHAQAESDRLGLGLRFLALAPRMTPGTGVGDLAIAGYASYRGLSKEQLVQQMDSPRTPQEVARALMSLLDDSQAHQGTAFTISASGVEAVA